MYISYAQETIVLQTARPCKPYHNNYSSTQYNIPDNSMMDGEWRVQIKSKCKCKQAQSQVQRGHPNYWGATTLAHSHSSTNH